MKNALLIAALLALVAFMQWLDADTANKIAAREHASRQQAIEAINAINCGESPFYLAQAPAEVE
ncbi:hypothetical protein U5817_09835 [Aromatoleum evansii]|uniref:DUF4148 domain-containing protein n=1 Tax=Aromatoleum evansii TaxID=59406 RepID=A0ABZ1AUN1_AROEV|nr:hypothetical protein U5817_09485 [Aromatoleum evansii]WRL48326.1 hypothetical protein U5817_09835 [Aromatoleum evansii]